MRSEMIYTAEHGYDDAPASAVLFDGAAVRAFGRGSGDVDWQGRPGTIEWTNFPQRRPDGTFLPNISGIIRLDDVERPILYRLHGISLLPNDAGVRLLAGAVRWFTDAEEFLWLNDRCGYEEGALSVEDLRIRSRAYALHPEAP